MNDTNMIKKAKMIFMLIEEHTPDTKQAWLDRYGRYLDDIIEDLISENLISKDEIVRSIDGVLYVIGSGKYNDERKRLLSQVTELKDMRNRIRIGNYTETEKQKIDQVGSVDTMLFDIDIEIDEIENEINYLMPQSEIKSLWNVTDNDTQDLIEDVIIGSGIGEIFGSSGHHKTFLILDMLFCIAHDIPFHGKKVQKGKVVYMAGEGRNGLIKRLEALSIHYNIPIDKSELVLPEKYFDLMNEDDMVELGKFLAIEYGVKIVIFDTLASFVNGFDMNGDTHWSIIKSNITKYLSPHVNVVSWVAHTNLSNNTRGKGSGQRYNDSDFVLRISKNTKNTDTSLEFTKVKDGEIPEKIWFKMKPIGDSLVPVLKVNIELTEVEKEVMVILGKDTATRTEFNLACDEAVTKHEGTKNKSTLTKRRQRVLKALMNKEKLFIIE